MKIHITFLAYDCVATLDRVFAPWREIKKGNSIIDEVYISVSHLIFPENVEYGLPILSEDGTVDKLYALKDEGVIDRLTVHGVPVQEQLGWSENIAGAEDADLICLLGSDEEYTVAEIENVVKFIQRNPFVDIFSINFKNYMAPDAWNDGFVAPRWWNNKRNGGVSTFYKEELCIWGNGKRDYETATLTIPNVNPVHWSWSLFREENESQESFLDRNLKFQKRKLAFSHRRFGCCSYQMNADGTGLEFNRDYYRRLGQGLPNVYKN